MQGMLVKEIKNNSAASITLKTTFGGEVQLGPNQKAKNIHISNMGEVRNAQSTNPGIKITEDLTEVKPVKESATKLYD